MKIQNLAVHSIEAKRIRWLGGTAALPFAIALMSAVPLAAQGGCQPVDVALNKVITVPAHIYAAISPIPKNGSTPRLSDTIHNETIYVGRSVYTKVGGKWYHEDETPQQVMKLEYENRQKSNFTCRYLRDESVNGETAAVYSTHSERSDPQAKADGQAWISKGSGLPLRQEFEIDPGHGTKNHYSMRYEYKNVQPPL